MVRRVKADRVVSLNELRLSDNLSREDADVRVIEGWGRQPAESGYGRRLGGSGLVVHLRVG